jgi:hypothetical protein
MYDIGSEFGNTTTTSGHYRGIELRFIISSGQGNVQALLALKSLEKMSGIMNVWPDRAFGNSIEYTKCIRLGCAGILRHDNVISTSAGMAPYPS